MSQDPAVTIKERVAREHQVTAEVRSGVRELLPVWAPAGYTGGHTFDAALDRWLVYVRPAQGLWMYAGMYETYSALHDFAAGYIELNVQRGPEP